VYRAAQVCPIGHSENDISARPSLGLRTACGGRSASRSDGVTTLLFVNASPRGAESPSKVVADAYLSALLERNPDLRIDTMHLPNESVPTFNHAAVSAKMAVITGVEFDDAQRATWDEVTAFARRFVDADRYLIAAPTWNGSIPHRLKRFIEIVHQPGITWTFRPKTGFVGLLAGKHATLVLTSERRRCGVVSGVAEEHDSTYLRDRLAEAGVNAVDEIRFRSDILSTDCVSGLLHARQQAVRLAARHGDLLATQSPM